MYKHNEEFTDQIQSEATIGFIKLCVDLADNLKMKTCFWIIKQNSENYVQTVARLKSVHGSV